MRIGAENDAAKRQAMIAEAFKIHAEDIGHLPLHVQPLVWGMSKGVEMVQLATNFIQFKWVVMR
jgi:peptide/nickel transport system substrate-binding protein